MKESSLTKEQQIKKVLTYRWVVYAILILSYFIVFVHRMSVGIIKQELVDSFAMTPVGFATLGAMYFYAY
ncbi:MAG: MFS transporter, partial [Eubacteriaceae bacterium]|nr:MFS transporter [Eubacteriaceae bacterium]